MLNADTLGIRYQESDLFIFFNHHYACFVDWARNFPSILFLHSYLHGCQISRIVY